MAQDWYYLLDGEQRGPISAAGLKQLAAAGKLKPDDKVKKDGMTGWVTASQVRGLFGASPVPAATAQQAESPPASPDRGHGGTVPDRTSPSSGGGVPPTRSAPGQPVRQPEPLPLPDEDEDNGDQAPMRSRGRQSRERVTSWATAISTWQRLSTPIKAGIVGGAGAVLLMLLLVPVMFLKGGNSSPPSDQAERTGTTRPGGSDSPGGAGVLLRGDPDTTRPGRSDSPDPRFKEAAKQTESLYANVDYTKGPNGEGLEPKEWTEGDLTIKARGFRRGNKFITHGLVTVCYASGKKESEAYWFNDKKHGPVLAWHRNGQKSWQGYLKNGKREGYQVFWYDEAGKDYEGVYKDGMNVGPVVKYYRNGNVMRETEYENHKFLGVVAKSEKWFDAEGKPANGPTIRALTKLDFVRVLEYRAKEHHVLPAANVVSGKVFPPNPTQRTHTILVNIDFDYFKKFIGLPESGLDEDIFHHPIQTWNYTCAEGLLSLRVEYAKTRVIIQGVNE